MEGLNELMDKLDEIIRLLTKISKVHDRLPYSGDVQYPPPTMPRPSKGVTLQYEDEEHEGWNGTQHAP